MVLELMVVCGKVAKAGSFHNWNENGVRLLGVHISVHQTRESHEVHTNDLGKLSNKIVSNDASFKSIS